MSKNRCFLQNMQTSCLSCKKHTLIILLQKKVILTDKTIKEALKWASCVTEKSKFLKQRV